MSGSDATDPRAQALRVFSLISTGDLALVEDLIADDYVDHRGGPTGREAFAHGLAAIRAAFPDWTSTPDDLVVEGDRVGARWTVRGTHQGPFLGMPATGRTIVMQEAGILRFRDGRLAELWRVADELALLRQLGALPDPAAP